jgi:hypothetical protein
MRLKTVIPQSIILACSSLQVTAHTVIEETAVIGHYVADASTASHGKITNEQLNERPILRTGEVLEAVPGLVATQHSGSGKANQYFLRGFNLDHGTDFSTSVDKMPVNMRSHGHGQGYTDLNFIIPELIGSITYKKGSYYADLGDFSGTGGAYIQTLEHADNSAIELGFGMDAYSRVLTTGGVNNGSEAQFIYGVELQQHDGAWEDIQEDINKKNIWLKQQWGRNENRFSLTAMYYDNSWNSADQIPERAVEQGIISELGSIDTSVGGKSNRYSVSSNWTRTNSNTLLDANFYAIHYEMDLWSNFTYFITPEGDQFEQVDDRNIYGWDLSYAINGRLGSINVTNTFGTQLRHDAVDEVGIFNSDARVRTGVYRLDEISETSISGYWENKIQWNDKLRSILGVRYDKYNFDVAALDARLVETIEPNSGKTSDDIITSSLSLVYEFNKNYEGFFSIGEGFHSNDARGTTIEFDPTTGDAVDPVDPLVPTFGYELGLHSHFSDQLDLSIALWYLQIDSELLFVGDGGATEDTGTGSDRNGLELTLYYNLTDATTLDLEYAHTNAKFEEAIEGSDKIPGALESVVSAGLNTHWNEHFYTHLRLRHFGKFPLDGGGTGGPSTLLNLRTHYEISSSWSIKLDILNLIDSNDRDIEYFYESQLATESSPVEDIHYHVFEPRTLRFSVEYRL